MKRPKGVNGPSQSGAAAVEFALVLPVLILLLFGIIQFGVVLFTYNNMVQAAREAARSLAVQDKTAADALALAQGQLMFNNLSFVIDICDPANPDPVNCPTATDVSVGISAPLSQATLVDVLGLFGSGTDCTVSGTLCLEARVTMRKEG